MSNSFIFQEMNKNSSLHKDLNFEVKTHASIPDPAVDSEGAEAPIGRDDLGSNSPTFLRG
jgi:hypothetical protein